MIGGLSILGGVIKTLGGKLLGKAVEEGKDNAINMVKKAFSVQNPNASGEDILAAINADPGAAGKIISVDREFEYAVRKLESDELIKRLDTQLKEVEIRSAERIQTLEQVVGNLKEVNITMRQEVQSESKFVKFARPSLIYSLHIIIGFTFLCIGYIFLKLPSELAFIPTFIDAIDNFIMSIVAVVGVYGIARSRDKKAERGASPGKIEELATAAMDGIKNKIKPNKVPRL